jgi:thymidylate synthase
VEKLKANPEDRRIVIQIWDAKELQKPEGKDFACNQQLLFDTRPLGDGRYALDMTVTNRSNDLIYGAMGSNLFHMSMLHEYIALHAGLQLGSYYQFSKNLHLYL